MKKESAETFRTLLREVYGPNPPLQCRARLEAEILQLPQSMVDELYLTHELRKAAREQRCDIDFESDYGASLIYFLTGCSNVNPLKPHYFCPVCKRTLFVETVEDGWDLPEKKCCGRSMLRDGHSIPFEMMKAHVGTRKMDSEYKIPESFMPKTKQVVQEYYRDKWLVVPYLTELERDGEAVLNDGYRIVHHNAPDDPGLHLALIPPEEGMPELDEDGIWQAPFQTIFDNDYRKIVFRRSMKKEGLAKVLSMHSETPTINDVLTEPAMEALSEVLNRIILSDDRLLPDEERLSFSALLRKKSYLRDDYAEDNPAVQSGHVRYTDLFSYRESVWELLDKTIPPETDARHILIEHITDAVSKGRYAAERMNPETVEMLKDFGISDHWIIQMKSSRFLSTKAKLINDTLDDLYYFWYKIQDLEDEDDGEDESLDEDE